MTAYRGVQNITTPPHTHTHTTVAGVLESHLHEDDAAKMTLGWGPDGLAPPHRHSGPRVVTLPYPISVSGVTEHFGQHLGADASGVNHEAKAGARGGWATERPGGASGRGHGD